MIVAHNLSAMNSHRNLTQTYGRLSKTLEHLTSGLRINRAADDATGLAISEKLRAQISSLRYSIMNAQDGITMIQTAEGALDRTHAILRRMRDLVELAANGDKTDGDREHYQAEIDNLLTEIDRIADTTEYNTKKLLNGVIGATVSEKSETNSDEQLDKLVVDGLVQATGEYKLSIYKAAERAKAVIVGGTTTGPSADAAGGFYSFLGAGGSTVAGNYTFKVESESKIALATVSAENNAGYSMSEAIEKINNAMTSAGIDATASYSTNGSTTLETIVIEANTYGSKHEIHVEISAQPEANSFVESNRNTAAGTPFAVYNSDLTSRTGKLLKTTQLAGAWGGTGNIDDLGVADGLGTGTFAVITRDNVRQIVSVSLMLAATADATIEDLVNRLNDLTNITVSFDEITGAISLNDSSTGINTFRVENGGSEDFGVADRLGIYKEVYGSSIVGVRLAKTDDYVIKVTDPDNNEAMLRGNQGDRSTQFGASASSYPLKSSGVDPDLAGSESATSGGIAGITFTLKEIKLKGVYNNSVHDHFSILATAGSLTLQVGSNEGWDHRVTFAVDDMGSSALGLGSGTNVTTQAAAFDLMDNKTIDTAINIVSLQRGKLGAFQNRLEHTIKNLGVTRENLQASESRIRDADMAEEMMEFTKYQIILQAGTAMLAQANQIPQSVLQLLG